MSLRSSSQQPPGIYCMSNAICSAISRTRQVGHRIFHLRVAPLCRVANLTHQVELTFWITHKAHFAILLFKFDSKRVYFFLLCNESIFVAIRRLTRNCKNVEQKVERRDFVEEYSGFGSQVHAPMTRVGVFLDRGSEQYVVRSRYLNTFQG